MTATTQPTALYRLYDTTEQLIYVGISTQPETRWTQHASDKPWWPLVSRKDVEWHAGRPQAEAAERAAVQSEGPLYNTAGAGQSLLAAHFPIGDTLTQSQARLRISDVLDATQFRGQDIAITRRGKVAGYFMAPENYDEAVEALAEKRRKAVGSPPPATAAPRQQVTQSLPKPEPIDLTGISPEVAGLSLERVRSLAASAEVRQPQWVADIREEYPDANELRLCYLIVDVGLLWGRKPPELATDLRPRLGGDNPLTAEEVTEFAALARSHADETQTKKIDQEAGKAPDGKKDLAAMHAALDMELLKHDEVYGERPVSSEEKTP